MIKKLIPLVAALAVAALFLGPARQYLPAALRLQTGGALVSTDDGHGTDMDMGKGKPSGIGLAPAAVVNPPATAARLTIAAQAAEKPEHGYVLAVRVTSPDGKPVADAPVKFFDIVDIFGPREMLLASVTTDGRGNASYEYLPASVGTRNIVVRFAGREGLRAGEARMALEAAVSAPRQSVERSGFASFSDRVPYAVGVLVLGVWTLIGFALFATARGVIAGARRTRGKEELA